MFTNNLFDTVLIKPALSGAKTLYIVSGYASPAIVYQHLNHVNDVSVNLIIGMAKRDGIRLGSHKTFKKLASSDFPGRFSCYYLSNNELAHAKSYGWFNGNAPKNGFIGSANYSNTAFLGNQIEAMESCDSGAIKDLYDSLIKKSINCLDPEVDKEVQFFDEVKIIKGEISIHEPLSTDYSITASHISNKYIGAPVTISLLTGTDTIGSRSGLNWGQRPGRNPNQAYIPLRPEIRDSDFFPPWGEHFVILTDDGKSLDCVRAQDGAKAIETFESNAILGSYFRERMGLPSGEFVTMDDFNKYGRHDITMYKIDDETYYMDFSV